MQQAVNFQRDSKDDFINVLRKRVREYFKEKNISRYANATMVFKTIFMVSLYLVPYFLMIFGVITNLWIMLLCWVIMGFGMSGIGLSIMHDAIHGSYSKKPWVNKFFGYFIHLVGGNAFNWNMQHNVLHHSYTNIDGLDHDIDSGKILRFSPNQKRYKIHKAQHIYAWFLYCLMTLSWMSSKDFKNLIQYKNLGLLKNEKRSFAGIFTELIVLKLLYYAYVIVIPIIFLPTPWWLTLIFIVLMHFVAGLILSCIFQLAHVMPTSEYPLPDKDGNMENNFAVHQMLTTANFSPNNKFLYWFVGGLNYQVEHHLFPNICHVHYKELSKIVEATAKEFGIPYNSQPTFFKALKVHKQMLRNLGRYDSMPAMA